MTFQIIPHKPADDDHFKGAHSHIASSLKELILNNKHSTIIGLDGKRGSGKSTIIQNLRKICQLDKTESGQPNKNIEIITIDTWAHGGNHLCRALLEKISTKLGNCENSETWISKGWSEKFEQLDVQEATQHFKPVKITKYAIHTTIATIFTLGALGYWKEFFELFLYNKSELIELFPPLSLAIFLSIPAIAFSINVYFNKDREDNFLDFISSLLKINASAETLATIRSSPDQNSLLFQKWFGEMLDPLNRNPNNRLVIVFDNLDRLDPNAQKETWKTLQIFLEAREIGLLPNNVMFIICFDLSIHNQKHNREEMNDRLEKILDSRFFVPIMPVAEWSQLARAELNERNFSEQESDEITTTLETLYAKDQRFSIRKLAQCANALRALEAQYKYSSNSTKVSFTLLTCYWHELNRGDFIEEEDHATKQNTKIIELSFIERLRTKKIDPKIKLALSTPLTEIVISFAQLYSGLNKDKATGYLLEEPIRKALADGDTGQLNDLANNFQAYKTTLRLILKEQGNSFIALNILIQYIRALWGKDSPNSIHDDCLKSCENLINLPNEQPTFLSDTIESDAQGLAFFLNKLSTENRQRLLKQLSTQRHGKKGTGTDGISNLFHFSTVLINQLPPADLSYFKPELSTDLSTLTSEIESIITFSAQYPIETRQFIKQLSINSDTFERLPSQMKHHSTYFKIVRDDFNVGEITTNMINAHPHLLAEFFDHYNQETKIGDYLNSLLEKEEPIPNTRYKLIIYLLHWIHNPETRNSEIPDDISTANIDLFNRCLERIDNITDDQIIKVLKDVIQLHPSSYSSIKNWLRSFQAYKEKRPS